MKPLQREANYGSDRLANPYRNEIKFDSSKCHDLVGKNEVKSDICKPLDTCRNQVKFDSCSPGNSSMHKPQPDISTFLTRPKDGGALFAQHMFSIYSMWVAKLPGGQTTSPFKPQSQGMGPAGCQTTSVPCGGVSELFIPGWV